MTSLAACSGATPSGPPVTLESLAGRYRLEKFDGTVLPTYGPVLCFLEGCGKPYMIIAGHLEIGTTGPPNWTSAITTRDSDSPFAEYTANRSGSLEVDYYGRLTFHEDDPNLVAQWRDGAIKGDELSVSGFGKYTFRRER